MRIEEVKKKYKDEWVLVEILKEQVKNNKIGTGVKTSTDEGLERYIK